MEYTKGAHSLKQQGEYNDRTKAIAIGACYSINPDNPMAVAESIRDMYEALKKLFAGVEVDPESLRGWYGNPIPTNEAIKMGLNALSKAESK